MTDSTRKDALDALEATRAPALRSWIESANDPLSDFPIQNLPFGIFSDEANPSPRAGVAIGADGLIVEMHPHPEKAMSDGAQSLDPMQFAKMMADLAPYIELWKQDRVTESAVVV